MIDVAGVNGGGAAIARSPAEDAMKSSRLLRRGGYLVVPQLLHPHVVRAMFEEACVLFPTANEEHRDGTDDEDWRGGLPPRRLLSAAGDRIQDQVYTAPALAWYLSELVGVPLCSSSNRASYSYYCRTGDYLAVHRDVEHCDVSVIVAISDNTDREAAGGELVVYPDRVDDPLSAVRADPEAGAVTVKLAAGQTLVIAGGMVPHAVRPMAPHQNRISAPMCFRVNT